MTGSYRPDLGELPDNDEAELRPVPATGSAPVAGLKYMLKHGRFGRATVKVTRVDQTWADCEVLSGTLRGMARGAVWGPGATKTIRIEHGVWTLVPDKMRWAPAIANTEPKNEN